MKKLKERLLRRWSLLVFRERDREIGPKIRALRLLEEAIELAQAEGVTMQEVGIVRDQVYAKPPGDPLQELGGVLICAVAHAAVRDWDHEEVFWAEFARIMDPELMEKVRRRNLEGDKIGFER